MKITNWAMIFVMVFSGLFWAEDLHAAQQRAGYLIEQRYNAVIRTAAQDGATRLNENELQKYEAGYDSERYFRANKERALSALLNTLYVNFGVVDDPLAQQALLQYIPAVLVIDYDGYYIYSSQETLSKNGEPQIQHLWSEKKPYTLIDEQGKAIRFTLDDQVEVLDSQRRQWSRGRRAELAASQDITILKQVARFDDIRRTTIVRCIEDDLAGVINKHNTYARQTGIKYTFTLPTIPDEDWDNTLADVGILVFLQGIPVGEQYYNNYSFGGGRLIKRKVIYGGVDLSSGIKYYYRESCKGSYKLEEVFTNEREAAVRGYFEAPCLTK